MIRIGPSGNSESFYYLGYKHTYQEPKWLSELGLNAFEYSFGHGVKISTETALKIKTEMEKYNIALSIHAPYYTNFANPDPMMIDKSINYVVDSLKAAKIMGAKRVVFHPASRGKMTREEAVELTKKNIFLLMSVLENENIMDDYFICPETLGKLNQIGTVEEIVDFCKISDRLIPCYDFGHINCYMQGGLKSIDDYRKIIDYTFEQLGEYKASRIHIHFSKIMYGPSGEIKHLTFADNKYGPDYEPLAKIIDEYKMQPTIICESSGTMAEDALKMKKYHKNI